MCSALQQSEEDCQGQEGDAQEARGGRHRGAGGEALGRGGGGEGAGRGGPERDGGRRRRRVGANALSEAGAIEGSSDPEREGNSDVSQATEDAEHAVRDWAHVKLVDTVSVWYVNGTAHLPPAPRPYVTVTVSSCSGVKC